MPPCSWISCHDQGCEFRLFSALCLKRTGRIKAVKAFLTTRKSYIHILII